MTGSSRPPQTFIIATDHASFRAYTPFKPQVLALGDQQKVPVLGIGTVMIKIRCQPASKDSHSITLKNVLYVPSWMCNVLSDVYFEPATVFSTPGQCSASASRKRLMKASPDSRASWRTFVASKDRFSRKRCVGGARCWTTRIGRSS